MLQQRLRFVFLEQTRDQRLHFLAPIHELRLPLFQVGFVLRGGQRDGQFIRTAVGSRGRAEHALQPQILRSVDAQRVAEADREQRGVQGEGERLDWKILEARSPDAGPEPSLS